MMIKLPRPAPKASKARTEATPEPAGNLCGVLVTFAAWRRCCCCGALTLYVDPRCGTSTEFECGNCRQIRDELVKRLVPSLPDRVRSHLRALLGATANDNATVRPW